MLSDAQLNDIADIFAILAEPARLRILRALLARPHTVGALVAALGMKQANVSKHLAVLLRAQLVSRTRNANSMTYRIANPIVRRLCRAACAN